MLEEVVSDDDLDAEAAALVGGSGGAERPGRRRSKPRRQPRDAQPLRGVKRPASGGGEAAA
jgi:hypothetical protein